MELTNGLLKRRELPGFAIVNGKKRPHPWDTHYQFSIKTLLSKEGGKRRKRKKPKQNKRQHTHTTKNKTKHNLNNKNNDTNNYNF